MNDLYGRITSGVTGVVIGWLMVLAIKLLSGVVCK